PVLRILRHQAVEHAMPLRRRKERKRVEHANRAFAAIEQFAEIRFAMPAFWVGRGLEAVILDPSVPRVESLDSIGSPKPTFAESFGDPKPSAGGRAFDNGPSRQFSHAVHVGSLTKSPAGWPPRTSHDPRD